VKKYVLITDIGIALGCPSIVASIVAAIGLGDRVHLGPAIDVTFQYAKGDSILGRKRPRATAIRSLESVRIHSYSVQERDLRDLILMPLSPPYALEAIVVREYELYILQNISDCLESRVSAEGDLRSSLFDIQFR
jgi:hypothetical protein